MLDDVVRDVENRLDAAEIFFELDNRRAGEMRRKIKDIAVIRAPKRINALRLVADGHDVIVRGGEQADNAGLQRVRVLIFVHHDETVDVREAAANFFMLVEQAARVEQQIVVIEQLMGEFVRDELMKQAFQFLGVFEVIEVIFAKNLLNGQALVDGFAEYRKDRGFFRKRFAFFTEAALIYEQFDHILRVALIHNREARRQIDRLAVAAQRQIGKRMERAARDFFASGV